MQRSSAASVSFTPSPSKRDLLSTNQNSLVDFLHPVQMDASDGKEVPAKTDRQSTSGYASSSALKSSGHHVRYLTEDYLRKVVKNTQWKDVSVLDLHRPSRGEFPIEIMENLHVFTSLTSLNLNGQQIDRILDIASLASLKELQIADNCLKALDCSPKTLPPNLEILNVAGNKIERIPKSVHHLQSLQVLRLARNPLRALSDTQRLKKLANLSCASFHGSPIAALSHFRGFVVCHLANLEILDGQCISTEERTDARERFGPTALDMLEEQLREVEDQRKQLEETVQVLTGALDEKDHSLSQLQSQMKGRTSADRRGVRTSFQPQSSRDSSLWEGFDWDRVAMESSSYLRDDALLHSQVENDAQVGPSPGAVLDLGELDRSLTEAVQATSTSSPSKKGESAQSGKESGSNSKMHPCTSCADLQEVLSQHTMAQSLTAADNKVLRNKIGELEACVRVMSMTIDGQREELHVLRAELDSSVADVELQQSQRHLQDMNRAVGAMAAVVAQRRAVSHELDSLKRDIEVIGKSPQKDEQDMLCQTDLTHCSDAQIEADLSIDSCDAATQSETSSLDGSVSENGTQAELLQPVQLELRVMPTESPVPKSTSSVDTQTRAEHSAKLVTLSLSHSIAEEAIMPITMVSVACNSEDPVSEFERQLKSLQDACAMTQSEHDNLREECEQLIEQVALLHTQKDECLQQITTLEGLEHERLEVATQNERMREDLTEVITELEDECMRLVEKKREFLSEFTQLEIDNESMERTHEAKIVELQTLQGELEGSCASLQERIAQYEEQEQSFCQAKELQEREEGLWNQKVESIKSTLSALKKEEQQWIEEQAQWSVARTQMRDEHQKLEHQLQMQNSKVESLQREIVECTQSLVRLEEQKQTKETTAREVELHLTSLKASAEDLVRLHESKRQEWRDDETRMQAKLLELETKYVAAEGKLHQMEIAYAESVKQVEMQEQACDVFRSEQAALDAALSEHRQRAEQERLGWVEAEANQIRQLEVIQQKHLQLQKVHAEVAEEFDTMSKEVVSLRNEQQLLQEQIASGRAEAQAMAREASLPIVTSQETVQNDRRMLTSPLVDGGVQTEDISDFAQKQSVIEASFARLQQEKAQQDRELQLLQEQMARPILLPTPARKDSSTSPVLPPAPLSQSAETQTETTTAAETDDVAKTEEKEKGKEEIVIPSELEKAIANAMHALQVVEDNVEAKTGEQRKLERLITSLKEEEKNLSEALGAMRDAMQETVTADGEATRQLEETEQALIQARDMLQVVQTEQEEAQKSLEDLERQTEQWHEEEVCRQSQIAATQAKIQSLHAMENESQQRMYELQQEVEQRTRQVERLELKTSRLTAVEVDHENLVQQITGLQQDIAAMKEQKGQLQQEQEEAQQWAKETSAWKQNAAEMQEQVHLLQGEMERMHAVAEQETTRLQQLLHQCTQAEGQKEAALLRASHMESVLAIAEQVWGMRKSSGPCDVVILSWEEHLSIQSELSHYRSQQSVPPPAAVGATISLPIRQEQPVISHPPLAVGSLPQSTVSHSTSTHNHRHNINDNDNDNGSQPGIPVVTMTEPTPTAMGNGNEGQLSPMMDASAWSARLVELKAQLDREHEEKNALTTLFKDQTHQLGHLYKTVENLSQAQRGMSRERSGSGSSSHSLASRSDLQLYKRERGRDRERERRSQRGGKDDEIMQIAESLEEAASVSQMGHDVQVAKLQAKDGKISALSAELSQARAILDEVMRGNKNATQFIAHMSTQLSEKGPLQAEWGVSEAMATWTQAQEPSHAKEKSHVTPEVDEHIVAEGRIHPNDLPPTQPSTIQPSSTAAASASAVETIPTLYVGLPTPLPVPTSTPVAQASGGMDGMGKTPLQGGRGRGEHLSAQTPVQDTWQFPLKSAGPFAFASHGHPGPGLNTASTSASRVSSVPNTLHDLQDLVRQQTVEKYRRLAVHLREG
jgi:Leucine-rich repeat (LRR) protein